MSATRTTEGAESTRPCSSRRGATILNVSVKTVEFHEARLMEQLDLHSTASLIKFASAEGLASA